VNPLIWFLDSLCSSIRTISAAPRAAWYGQFPGAVALPEVLGSARQSDNDSLNLGAPGQASVVSAQSSALATRHCRADSQAHKLDLVTPMTSSANSAALVKSSRPHSAAAELPRCVLLAGSARGGTSWALKVLDSHPSVCGCHEPFYQLNTDESLRSLFDRLKAGQGTDEDTRRLISSAINGCVETHKPPFFRKEFLKSPAWLRTAAWMSAKALRPLKPVFQYMATGNLNRSHCLVIKNRPFLLLDRILESIHADAILLLRHPCGVVSSWLRGMRMGVMQAASADPVAVWARYSNSLEPLGFTAQQLATNTTRQRVAAFTESCPNPGTVCRCILLQPSYANRFSATVPFGEVLTS